jgi:hypothetical protein
VEHVVEHVLVVEREAEVRVRVCGRGDRHAGAVTNDRRALLPASELLGQLDVQLPDPGLVAAEAGADDVEARQASRIDDLARQVVEPGAGDERRQLARDAYEGSSRP